MYKHKRALRPPRTSNVCACVVSAPRAIFVAPSSPSLPPLSLLSPHSRARCLLICAQHGRPALAQHGPQHGLAAAAEPFSDEEDPCALSKQADAAGAAVFVAVCALVVGVCVSVCERLRVAGSRCVSGVNRRRMETKGDVSGGERRRYETGGDRRRRVTPGSSAERRQLMVSIS